MKLKTMRRLYRREAAVMLLLARLAVRFVPPARIFAWAERSPRRICRFAVDDVSWIAWAIESVGARAWMKSRLFAARAGGAGHAAPARHSEPALPRRRPRRR